MLLHESEEVQVSGEHYLRMGFFEERRGSPRYSPYTRQQLPQTQLSSLQASLLRDLRPNPAAAAQHWLLRERSGGTVLHSPRGEKQALKCSVITAAVSKIQILMTYGKN